MRRFILRRFAFALVSIITATFAVFMLSRLAGDPLLLYANSGYGITAEGEAALRKRLGLDRPVPVQYALWLGRTLKGVMGETILDRKPVSRIVTQRLPSTIHLGGTAFLLSFMVGIPLGILSAVWRGSFGDYVGRFLALLGQAVPSFWLGLVLIMLFAVQWRLFPPADRKSTRLNSSH